MDDPGIDTPAWFCLRTQLKHEHIALAYLKSQAGIEVFLPRIRFKRVTRRGPSLVTEALFPNYLFAHFDLALTLSRVRYAPGVAGIVRFGLKYPTVPRPVIEDLSRLLGRESIHEIVTTPEIGERIKVVGGHFHAFEGILTQVVSGATRVRVLLEFLGGQNSVDLPSNSVIKAGAPRDFIR